jgi:hypothetical protein
MAEQSPTTTAAKEQIAKANEVRAKSQEKAVKSMEGVKPTPTQEENDLARMGVDVVTKEPDGSPVEGEPPETPPENPPESPEQQQRRQAAARAAAGRQSQPGGGGGSSS